MTPSTSRVAAVAVPAQSRIAALYPRPDLADLLALPLPEGASTDPETRPMRWPPLWKQSNWRHVCARAAERTAGIFKATPSETWTMTSPRTAT